MMRRRRAHLPYLEVEAVQSPASGGLVRLTMAGAAMLLTTTEARALGTWLHDAAMTAELEAEDPEGGETDA